jgi:hypothetical protein
VIFPCSGVVRLSTSISRNFDKISRQTVRWRSPAPVRLILRVDAEAAARLHTVRVEQRLASLLLQIGHGTEQQQQESPPPPQSRKGAWRRGDPLLQILQWSPSIGNGYRGLLEYLTSC